jgi:mannose-6-phosphate isomerase-like protein (cupin superfamily)
MPRSIILSLALIAAPSPIAQTVHTTADMQQREAKLLATAKAAPTGLGTDIMDDYGNDRTLLVVRVHSGDPERHQFWADEMVVKKGTITLGTSIEGGKETVLHAGDIVHIPAGMPHQAKIAPGTTVTYLVFKEKEK